VSRQMVPLITGDGTAYRPSRAVGSRQTAAEGEVPHHPDLTYAESEGEPISVNSRIDA
jgi:hypothetical protein